MSLLRRLIAALTSALLLQLTLLGSGTLRASSLPAASGTHAAAAGTAGVTHGISSMSHAPAPESMPSGAPDMPQGCDMPGNGTDCHLPSAPGMCSSAATCASAGVPVVIAVLPLPGASGAAILPEPTSFSSGPASAPELPPPRT